MNTAAVQDPSLVLSSSEKFGSQCIVVAIDAKRKPASNGRWSKAGQILELGDEEELRRIRPSLKWEVYIHGGRTATGIDAQEWAQKVERNGAGEILLTSMDRDGTKGGYDILLTRMISDAVRIPVIASGGAGTLDHLREALSWGRADAVLAASIFHFREYSIRQVKEYLKAQGIKVRGI